MGKIYIFGHKKPDTDSVTSAISLAYLKNKQGFDAEAKVLGRLNNETKFALKYFNVNCPEYLNDVKTQIKDVNYNRISINRHTSIKKCYDILKSNKISGAPVVDEGGKLVGIITLKDISSYFIEGDVIKLKTSYDNILDALGGSEVLRFDNEIEGNILTASYRSTTFLNNIDLDKHTILIVVDRHSILEYAVNSSVKMIIIVGDGFLRLVDINDKNKKKVILVDHNEIVQSVDGIEESDIIEVIDHHKIGTLTTSSPINFRNMAVGSTNTIIHQLYEENNFPIPKDIAGIMLSGIISDTLLLKSPTTTQLDKQAVFRLSMIAGVDYEKYGIEMFRAGSSIKGKSMEQILFSDFKVFKVANIESGIGQIFTTDYNSLKLDKAAFVKLLNETSINNDYMIVTLFITDVMKNGSYILFNDKAKHILEDSFNIENLTQGYYLDGVVSRKKQILPPIIEVLERR